MQDLLEALERQLFKLGGRTNPRGYYLDVSTNGFVTSEGGILIPAILKSPNDLMRMNLETEYRGYRNDWFRVLDQAIPKAKRPRKPLTNVRMMFQIFSNRPEKQLLDAEAKYSAVKPLMDCLQPPTVFKGSGKAVTRMGVGLIEDDTDGEHFRSGVIRQLEVLQRKVMKTSLPRVRIVVEQVTDWG